MWPFEDNYPPKLRTSARGDIERSVINNARRIEDWHTKELDIVWNMDSDLRRLALSFDNL